MKNARQAMYEKLLAASEGTGVVMLQVSTLREAAGMIAELTATEALARDVFGGMDAAEQDIFKRCRPEHRDRINRLIGENK